MPLLTSAVCLLALHALPQQPATETETVIISGRVIDLRGEGVPVAKVWINDPDDEGKKQRSTVADAEGFFRMSRVQPASFYTIYATAEGHSLSSGYARSSLATTVLLHDATTIRGVLHNAAGQPVAGVVVAASSSGRVLRRQQALGTTDAEGRFTIERVALGRTHIGAWVPGEGLAEQHLRIRGDDKITLKSNAPGTTATAKLTINVEGLPKKHGPEVTVNWNPMRSGSATYLPPPWKKPTFRGHSWSAEGLPDWSYNVRLRAEGWTFQPKMIPSKRGEQSHEMSFHATRIAQPDQKGSGVRCKAIVKDAAGNPVAGVPFVLREVNSNVRAQAVSDESGRMVFEVPAVAGTEVIVYTDDNRWVANQDKSNFARSPISRSYATRHRCNVDPETLLQLTVVPASSITGRLLLSDGRPASFVNVELQGSAPHRMPTWMSFDSGTTDRDGYYSFHGLHHAAEGTRVFVDGVLGSASSKSFSLEQVGSKVKVPDFQLVAPAAIEGVVRDADGQPAPGVTVWLRDWDMARDTIRSGSVTEVITDRLGRYRFPGVPLGGAYLEIVLEANNRQKKCGDPFEIEAGQTYTLDLVDDR